MAGYADRFKELGLNPPGDGDVELAWHETVRNIFDSGHRLKSKLKKSDHDESVAALEARTEEA
jgi:hypothetical protein